MGESHPAEGRALGLITAENGQSADLGTALAIYTDILSCSLVRARSNGWGGARNHADRLSECLTQVQCEKLVAAALHAERIGLAFNRHWTVHSEKAGIQPHDGQAFVGRLLRSASREAKRAGGQVAAIWVRENGDGKGEHVHVLMHLPPGLDLRNKTRRWIVAAGGTYRRNVSYVRQIGGPLKRFDPTSEHYQANADAVIGYLLKGADEAAASAFGLSDWGQFGWIIGKRCGATENIGKAARERLQRMRGG